MNSNTDKLLTYAKQHGGLISTAQAKAMGIYRSSVYSLLKSGKLVKKERGIYGLPDADDDPLFGFQQSHTRCIFALETALYLHGLTEATSDEFTVVFPRGYNTSTVKSDGFITKTESLKTYGEGIEDIKTPQGNLVKCYSVERTLCDIVRPLNKVASEVIEQAYRRYLAKPHNNLSKLKEFAKLLSVEQQANAYLEKFAD
jgi:predicted transcriptional regulator of viral defense system